MITVSTTKNAAAALAARLAISTSEARKIFDRFCNAVMIDGLRNIHGCEAVVEHSTYGENPEGVAYLYAPSQIDGAMVQVATLFLTTHEIRNWRKMTLEDSCAISDRLRLAA